jgi:outer-membrane receptor for ferric coprogen and ferric-rhodotorulic acid
MMESSRIKSLTLAVRLAFTGMGATCISLAHAQTSVQTVQQYNIPAGPLYPALTAFKAQSGVNLSFDPKLTEGKRTVGITGSYSAQEALARLLAGSGLDSVAQADGLYTLRAQPQGTQLPQVLVTAAEDSSFGDIAPDSGLKANEQSSSTKTPLSIRETPQAISVITRESMDMRQVHDINSALELAAGVSTAGAAFAGSNPRTGEGFTLRGQTLDGDRDVRIDGFSSAADRNELDLAPFERVEAIKGPSSMLYGQGSLGGFINLVRKKPQAEPMAEIVMQAGSWDSYRTEVDLGGAIDKNNSLLGRVTAAYEDTGSFIDGVNSQRTVIAPSLEAFIGERTRALLQVIYQDDNFKPSLGVPLRQVGNQLKPLPRISPSYYFGQPASDDSTVEQMHTTLRLDHELSDRWLATLHVHHSHTELTGLSDSYGYGIYANNTTYVYASRVEHDQDSLAGEFRLDGKFDAFGREHRALFGVEANKKDFLSHGSPAPLLGIRNIYSPASFPSTSAANLPEGYRDHTKGSNRAAYGQAILSILDRTKLLLGARFDRAYQERVESFTPGRHSKTDYAWTYRVGLTQDLTRELTAYGTWAQSFNPVLDASRGGILDPETGEGYEIGLKGEWFEKRLSASIAAFRQELENSPIADPNNGPGENFNVSAGLQRTDGIEIEVSGSPWPGLTVGFAATWLDAEYTDRRDPNEGLTPDGNVEWQSALFLNYALTGNWEVGTTLVSVGDRTVIGSDASGEPTNLSIDGYERIDLHARYKGLRGWDISLLLRNVTDEEYIERVNSAFAYAHFFGSPRAFLLRAEHKFK